MKKIIAYFTIFSFFFSQTFANAASIQHKLDIQTNSCSSNLSFEEYIDCLQNVNLLGKNLKKKKLNDMLKIFSIGQVYYESVYENLITEEKAFQLWNKLLNNNYGKKLNKKKFEDMINNSKCFHISVYGDFIDCYYDEFRNFEVYKNSSPAVKERLEYITFHALALKNKENKIAIASEYSMGRISGGEVDKFFKGEEDGFAYLFFMVDAIGSDFYSNKSVVKTYSLNKSEIKTILIYLVVIISISYIAKKMLAKKFSTTGPGSASSSSTASSGTQAFTTYQQNPISYTNKILPQVFRSAPANSILHNPWFRYNLFF